MSIEEVHKDDIGTIFEATIMDGSVVVDISGASVKELIFKKPSGTVVVQSAEFTTDGTDGKIQYTTILGDLDETGKWKLQGHVLLPTGEWRTDIYEFTVYNNLE